MTRQLFSDFGPLDPRDQAHLYITRDEDGVVRDELEAVGRQCVLVSLIGARETGKTSLIYRLQHDFAPMSWVTVRLDLSTLSKLQGEQWYRSLVANSSRELEPATGINLEDLRKRCEQYAIPLWSPQGWTELLWLTCQRLAPTQRLLFALDGVNDMPHTHWGPLFSNIRTIYEAAKSSMGSGAAYKKLGIALSGSFVPKQLITDQNSPFNVGKLVYMSLITSDNLHTMREALNSYGIEVEAAALQALYNWSGGVLHYIKRLCAEIEQFRRTPVTQKMVKDFAESIAAYDTYIATARQQLEADPTLARYALEILKKPLKQNRNCVPIATLEILGVICYNKVTDRWVITNQLFERLVGDLQPVAVVQQPGFIKEGTNVEALAVPILTKAIDFLFDQASNIMQERREHRQKLREQDDTTPQASGATPSKDEVIKVVQPRVVQLGLTSRIESCMRLVETYQRNRSFTLEKIGHRGGLMNSSIELNSDLILQENELKKYSQELKELVEQAYGQKITIAGLE